MILKSKLSVQRSVLDVVKLWAKNRSKDPSTQVGAGVYDPINGGLFLGYNGFPSGIPDASEVWHSTQKYTYVIHAEVNAVVKALRCGVDVSQCWLVCSHLPCQNCMRDVIALHKPKLVLYESLKSSLINESAKQFASHICDTLGITLEQFTNDAD